jgi:hypothetical protein
MLKNINYLPNQLKKNQRIVIIFLTGSYKVNSI